MRVGKFERALRVALLGIILAAASGCIVIRRGHGPTGASGETAEVGTPRLAIISAYKGEHKGLLKATKTERRVWLKGHAYDVGRLAGHDVVLFLCGKSMVNAAIYTQIAIDHFDIRGIVVSGIAGGVNPNLHIGDVVVPDRWAEHDETLLAKQTGPNTYDLGDHGERPFPGHPHFGMIFPRGVQVYRDGKTSVKYWFDADPGYLAAARRAARNARLSRRAPDGRELKHAPWVTVGGNGVSGMSFVENVAYRKWIWKAFKANGVDMESAAVAQTAYVNQLPFIAFRSLSDLAGAGPSTETRIFLKGLAARNSASYVIAFLKALPPE